MTRNDSGSALLKCVLAATYLSLSASGGYSQPFGSRDQVAAKNIFLVTAATFKCDNFNPNFARMREYAEQNGVDIEALKDFNGKYKGRKEYAIQIVAAHIKLAGTGSLCAAIIQDFGRSGKLAAGLATEK